MTLGSSNRLRVLVAAALLALSLIVILSPVSRNLPPSEALAQDTEVRIDLADIAFRPADLSVPADSPFALVLVNVGAAIHNFSIDELDIDVEVGPGESERIELKIPVGTYSFYCNIPGHKEAGMVGTLVATNDLSLHVSGSPVATPLSVEVSLEDRMAAMEATVASLQTTVESLAEPEATEPIPTHGTTISSEPVATSTPPPIQTGDGTSRTSPLATGQIGHVGDYDIKVVTVDTDAEATVLAANQFNDPALSGKRMVLATLEATYLGEDIGTPFWDLTFEVVGARGLGYTATDDGVDCGSFSNQVSDAPDMYPSGRTTFDVCWQVPYDEADSLVMVVRPLFSPGAKDRVYFDLGSASVVDASTEPGVAGSVVATQFPTAASVPTSSVALADDYELLGRIGDSWTFTVGVLDDHLNFAAVRVEEPSSISASYVKQPAGHWVVVVLDIWVTDSAYSAFPFEGFVLQDGDGRVFDPNLTASNSWSVEHGDMQLSFEDWYRESSFDNPEVHHTAGLVFDVPEDSSGLLLRSIDGVLAIELDR